MQESQRPFYNIPFWSCSTLLAHSHYILNNLIYRNMGPGYDPNGVTVSPPLFSAFTEVYLIIFQRIQVRVGLTVICSRFFCLQHPKGTLCNKWKVAFLPTGFPGLLRVVKVSESLQKVFKYIIFEVSGNLIQRVVNSSQNSIPVIISSYRAEWGNSHLWKDLHFSFFVCLYNKTDLQSSEMYPTLNLQPEKQKKR